MYSVLFHNAATRVTRVYPGTIHYQNSQIDGNDPNTIAKMQDSIVKKKRENITFEERSRK
jgi:hypothetical protein